MKLLRIGSSLLLALATAACSGGPRLSPYRIDVRQGNYVSQEMVARLRPGMTKDQVRFILGTPLIADMFHADRWDYVYRFQPGFGQAQQRRLTVLFEDNKLVSVAGDVVPAGSGQSAEAVGAAGANRAEEIAPEERSAAPAAPDASRQPAVSN